MALPKSYLTSAKNLPAVFEAISGAQAPERFTQRFLESLEFKSTSDRLVISVLKSLGFLADDGRPTERYFAFLDQTQSAIVLAEGIREAYADLFQVNREAHKLQRPDLIGKIKTLSQGQYSESVVDKIALTFSELCKLADFDTRAAVRNLGETDKKDEVENEESSTEEGQISFGGLHYNIQLILPASRDPKVYDVLFRALREHLK